MPGDQRRLTTVLELEELEEVEEEVEEVEEVIIFDFYLVEH